MTTALLDVNVLLALAWPNHQMHANASRWFSDRDGPWGTCATTQLGFVRLSSHPAFTPDARSPREVRQLLAGMTAHGRHRYLIESLEPAAEAFGAMVRPLQGPKQVTDAWLVLLAQHHGCRLATFDRRLASWAPEGILELI